MCSSDELIHDARQVDLEEIIVTNETPMYLVPGRLTKAQTAIANGAFYNPCGMPPIEAIIKAIGTPIQPCADVEAACWINPEWLAFLHDQRDNPTAAYASAGATPIASAPEDIPLVRRTDMEVQVARVAAEKDAEIARLRNVLTAIASREIGDSPAPSQAHIAQLEWDIEWCQRKARAALNEGAAG